jgi:hypothetical protein
MSSPTPSAPNPVPAHAAAAVPETVTVISHSTLFYWWPVWAVGFLMAILTFIDNHRMVIIPEEKDNEFIVYYDKDPNTDEGKKKANVIAVAPKNSRVVAVTDDEGKLVAHLYPNKPRVVAVSEKTELRRPDGGTEPVEKGQDVVIPGAPTAKISSGGTKDSTKLLEVSRSPRYGVIWATFLLLVIFITNVPMRGLWSVVIIVTIVLMSIIFALAGWWDTIFYYLGLLDIRINAGGYILISSILFGLWLITLLFFDRQMYIQFTPGQFKVCTEIGGGERVFDATGMKLEKQRSDLFRHWILGLGSGDLIVRTSGAANEHFDLPNVLFIGKTVERVEEMMKRKAVVGAH